jgi:S1-C subfamily serine protease
MRTRIAALSILAAAAAGCGDGGAPEGTSAAPPAPLRVTVAHGLSEDVATAVPAGGRRVVTVAHVLRRAARVEVAGRRARVLRTDARADLAVLAVPGLRTAPLRLADGGGDGRAWVLRGGYPRALAAPVRRRAIATVAPPGGQGGVRRPVLELGASVTAGDSGAPVTDARGRVLGIVFARSERRAGTAWAVAASAVRAVLAGTRPARLRRPRAAGR